MDNQEEDNWDKARQIVERIINDRYEGWASLLNKERGSVTAEHEKVFVWLEQGNGDRKSADECVDLYELSRRFG